MSEIAYNINGEAFDLPATATGWRVRRMKPRGAPEVVYSKEGLPVIAPIEAGIEDLRPLVGAPGRYRLDAVDDHGRTVENLPAAYVVVPSRGGADAQVQLPHIERIADGGASVVMAEAMRLNTELAKSIVDRFPQMMQAAAELLRAADGAGLPAREPRFIERDDDEDHEDGDEAPSPLPAGFDLNTIVAQIVPVLVQTLMSGGKLPSLASLLDWRKATAAGSGKNVSMKQGNAAPVGQPANENAEVSPADTAEDVGDNAAPTPPELPPLDPATMAHFIAIQSALTPDEAALARAVAADLAPAELRAWFDELKKLSVPQAVQKIRVLIAGNTEAVS